MGVEVPGNSLYNNCMMNVRMIDKIEKGDLVGDGFEDGIVVDIVVDGGDVWYGVFDGKEAWQLHLRDVVKVNDEYVKDSIEGDV